MNLLLDPAPHTLTHAHTPTLVFVYTYVTTQHLTVDSEPACHMRVSRGQNRLYLEVSNFYNTVVQKMSIEHEKTTQANISCFVCVSIPMNYK